MKAIIAAMDEFRGIGRNGVLPWHIPADLKRFKELTKNSICIMGYNTYHEIADRFKYETTGKFLPSRLSIVVTSRDIPHSGEAYDVIPSKGIVITAKSIQEALDLVTERAEDIFFIGGESIFKEALDFVDKLYFTIIYQSLDLNPANDRFHCDRFFPIDHRRMDWRYIDNTEDSEWFEHEDGYNYFFSDITLLKDEHES